MEYVLTRHARERMKERGIPKHLLGLALREPTETLRDRDGRLLIKKVYRQRGNQRMLLVIGVPAGTILKIITVIDTSKWKKYL